MKKTYLIVAVTFCMAAAGMVALAQSTVGLTLTDVAVNGSTVTNSGTFVYGMVEGIYVDVTGAAVTNRVIVTTVGGSGAPPSRTLLNASVLTDAYFPIRLYGVDTGGVVVASEFARVPLSQDKIKLEVTAVNPSNTIDTTVLIYLTR